VATADSFAGADGGKPPTQDLLQCKVGAATLSDR
jgi:hypothetical protein